LNLVYQGSILLLSVEQQGSRNPGGVFD